MKQEKICSIWMMFVLAVGTTFALTSCSSDNDTNASNDANMDSNNPNEASVTSSSTVKDCQSVTLKGFANNALGKVGFCYSSTNPNPTPENSQFVETAVINSDNSYEVTVNGVTPNTLYYYRAYATKGETKVLAKEVRTFSTETHTVTAAAKVLDYQSVVLSGTTNSAIDKLGFYYYTAPDPSYYYYITTPYSIPENAKYVEVDVKKSDNSYEITIEGLESNTTYYYSTYATRGEWTFLADVQKSFTTEKNTVPIAFSANLFNTTSQKLNDFGVFAYEQGANAFANYINNNQPILMDNQKVYNQSSEWTYSPLKYFSDKKGALHSFFAYAPYNPSVKPVLGDGGYPAISYNIYDNIDLLYAAPSIDLPIPTSEKRIDFVFKHALAKVNVYASLFKESDSYNHAIDSNTKVVVRSVRLLGNFARSGNLNLFDGSWSANNALTGDYDIPSQVQISNNINKITTIDEGVMLIPSSKTKIRITYDVITRDPDDPINNSTLTNTITSEKIYELKQGKVYNFYLTLGMVSTKFDCVMSDWE